MKYITCEGGYALVHAYHFQFLNLLKSLWCQITGKNIILPWFLFKELYSMNTKFKMGKPELLSHHHLVKLLICNTLLPPFMVDLLKNQKHWNTSFLLKGTTSFQVIPSANFSSRNTFSIHKIYQVDDSKREISKIKRGIWYH